MQRPIFYTAGDTPALVHAKNRLCQWGCGFSPIPNEYVTHLLLPVPSFQSPGVIKGGQDLSHTLKYLPENIVILGGNLPSLPYRCVDFLKDEAYLQENADITAQCALALLTQQRSLEGAKVLIIGHGRIGKAALPLLSRQGAVVSTAVRRDDALAQVLADGGQGVLIGQWHPEEYDIILNTAPAAVLDAVQAKPTALLMDLASVPGITGPGVQWERGLPSRYAPETSGTLIAKTVFRYVMGKELT